ncbi:MAG TPA: hypothetical protein VIJ46_07160, partial [Rhabdochlamydiaceae bacterium]
SRCRFSASAFRAANATSSASYNLNPDSGASNNNFYTIERPAATSFIPANIYARAKASGAASSFSSNDPAQSFASL